MNISKAPFGTVDGESVDLYTLENDQGMVAKISTYGGIVTSLIVPDRQGTRADIVCGFDTLDGYFTEAYRANSPYFGALIGRYAARVKDGKIKVGDATYSLTCNAGSNHIHGGVKGFDKCIWSAAIDGDALLLRLTSPDGDEGYPGQLDVTVRYTLTQDNELMIEYSATTDHATAVSLTNHSYFNLSGFHDNVLGYRAMIEADQFLVPDATDVPLGELADVAGTVWDYNRAKPIGEVFAEDPKGFEHYYVFRKPVGAFAKVAEISDDASGRTLTVSSSEPGMLMYTAYYTSDELHRESREQFGQFRAFCCEASRYPNGPNIEGSPNSILQPGETYESKTVYALSW